MKARKGTLDSRIRGRLCDQIDQGKKLAKMVIEMETCLCDNKTWDDMEGDPWLALVKKAREILK